MHPMKPYHRKPVKGERVWIEQVKMSDIPAGANPFHYDSCNMGTLLVDDWTAMHAKGHANDEGLAYLDLVNVGSGQRFELRLWPELAVPDNRALPTHKYHLSFSTLGGAHYTLGYDEKTEAVAAMVSFSTYRQVFRLHLTLHGMTECPVAWVAGGKVLLTLDEYHQEASWGDEDVMLVDVQDCKADRLWNEPGQVEGEQHMCLACPACGGTLSSIHDMRGLTVTHVCSGQAIANIHVPSELTIDMGEPPLPKIDLLALCGG